MPPLRIFIGYDPREPLPYHVLAHSILARASEPVCITPLRRESLLLYHSRPRDERASTAFSLTRFLVPALCQYEGWALYLDCDMLCRVDIARLFWRGQEDGDSVYCVPHDYTPAGGTKFLGQPQHAYPRKNWSSLMLFNAAKCTSLTLDYVNTAEPSLLHRFAWMPDREIGALGTEWNWLVGEYKPNPAAKILHYTLGGPWWPATKDCDHAAEWEAERAAMEACA